MIYTELIPAKDARLATQQLIGNLKGQIMSFNKLLVETIAARRDCITLVNLSEDMRTQLLISGYLLTYNDNNTEVRWDTLN